MRNNTTVEEKCSQNSNTNHSSNANNKRPRKKKKNYNKSTTNHVDQVNNYEGSKPKGSVITKFGTNDVKWYQNVPGYENWASISWAKILGNDVGLQGPKYTAITEPNVSTTVNAEYTPTVIPGIMKIEFAPTFGKITNNQDPINIAGQYVMSDIRSKLRATNKYDRSEVIMLIGAMSSVYMWYEDVCRAYKTVAFYNSESRYQPDALCTAMGYSHQFLMKNINDIEGFLKIAAYKIASINIPDIFDYINRQKWMVENVYADGEDKRSQLYLFQPQYFYRWREGSNDEPTYLAAESRATVFNIHNGDADSVVNSMDQLWYALEHLLSPLLGSEDVGDISGDIANAYGDSDLIKLSYPSDDPISFIVDAEVGNEIANLTNPCSLVYEDKVEQNLTDLTAGPYVKANPRVRARVSDAALYNTDVYLTFFQNMDYILNADGMEQGPATVLTSTRLMCTFEEYGTVTGGSCPTSGFKASGSEIVVGVKIFTRMVNGTVHIVPFNTVEFIAQDGDKAVALNNCFVNDQIRISSFRWRPTQYIYSVSSATTENGETKISGPAQYQGIICPTQQYTKMPAQTLQDISDYCMISLFTPHR